MRRRCSVERHRAPSFSMCASKDSAGAQSGSLATLRALIVDPTSSPVVVHCAGGRDRTGVAVAFVQLALGVPDQHIAEDFALSSQLLELGAPQSEFDLLFGSISDIPRDDIVRALSTRAETMLALLDRLRSTYGSPDNILAALSVQPSLLALLRADPTYRT